MSGPARAVTGDGGTGPNAFLTFGKGLLVIDTGTYDGLPAVFIAPASKPGRVGARATEENAPPDSLIPGEIVMTFLTREHACFVADALVFGVRS